MSTWNKFLRSAGGNEMRNFLLIIAIICFVQVDGIAHLTNYMNGTGTLDQLGEAWIWTAGAFLVHALWTSGPLKPSRPPVFEGTGGTEPGPEPSGRGLLRLSDHPRHDPPGERKLAGKGRSARSRGE
jgi:hypothetical protein